MIGSAVAAGDFNNDGIDDLGPALPGGFVESPGRAVQSSGFRDDVEGRAGVELAYRQSRPIVVLKGVSVMGVPVPNAWLGGIKNIDLVNEYGEGDGFWQAFERVSMTSMSARARSASISRNNFGHQALP